VNALFNQPRGITVDGSGNLYVADTGNSAIRKITPAGTVSTLVVTVASGSSGSTGSGSGSGVTTPPSSSGGGGGGGGAPSLWFYGALSLLVPPALLFAHVKSAEFIFRMAHGERSPFKNIPWAFLSVALATR